MSDIKASVVIATYNRQDILQKFLEKAEIYQVPGCVRYSADVFVDRHPAIQFLPVVWRSIIFGIGISQEVPG